MVHFASFFVTAAVFAATVAAHPGQAPHTRSAAELADHQQFLASSSRALAACANSEANKQLQARLVARRAAKVEALRQERKLQAQRELSAATVIAKSHKSSLTGLTNNSDPSTYFGSTAACILEPEVTQGPYYVSGEYIRNDIRETQAGVDLYTELQIIDVNTCLPVENLYIDFWHCNSTGVYSGIVAQGNGNYNDKTNTKNTFARGLAPTDEDGLVQFQTKFPGHYTSRATHIHVLGTHDGTLLPNNTYAGGYASHVGQIFFDQSLISQVEATAPYNTNKQTLTTNAQDSILAQEAAGSFDPVVNYVLLGDSVSDGIFSWISIGIDKTRAQKITPAGKYTGARN